jgi:hypothetical protein
VVDTAVLSSLDLGLELETRWSQIPVEWLQIPLEALFIRARRYNAALANENP